MAVALNALEHNQLVLGSFWASAGLLCSVSLQDTQLSSFKGNLEKACPPFPQNRPEHPQPVTGEMPSGYQLSRNSACIEGHLPPHSQGHSFSKMSPLHELPQIALALVTVKYSHSTICWQENATVLVCPLNPGVGSLQIQVEISGKQLSFHR